MKRKTEIASFLIILILGVFIFLVNILIILHLFYGKEPNNILESIFDFVLTPSISPCEFSWQDAKHAPGQTLWGCLFFSILGIILIFGSISAIFNTLNTKKQFLTIEYSKYLEYLKRNNRERKDKGLSQKPILKFNEWIETQKLFSK